MKKILSTLMISMTVLMGVQAVSADQTVDGKSTWTNVKYLDTKWTIFLESQRKTRHGVKRI